MQTLKETFKENQTKTNKRPTSSMRYPKQMPSYIVAFAVHETYDDITTAQQMICNKRSIQGSTSSVSPALSSKTIKLEHSAPKISNTDRIESSSEVKINVDEFIDKNEDINEIETPSEVKNSVNEIFDTNEDINDNNNNKLPEKTEDYFVVHNREEEDINQPDDNIIVIESKHIKRQANRLLKKKRQSNCRIVNVNFKYNKKTLKRGKKASKTPACAAKFKETFYSDSVSKVVSRTSLLKTVAAKENILEAVDSIFSDEDNINDESVHSSPSTAKKSFISYSSDDTLTRQGSISSKNEDLTSLGTINSVIKIPSPIVTPYKTEVINVSVAVAYNPSSNDNAQDNVSAEPYRSIFDRDLLSTETLVKPALLLTSDSGSSGASENVPNAYMEGISIKNSSDGTLKPIINSENTFIVGNTSSDADDSMPSESTLTPNSEKFMYAENLRQTPSAVENQERTYNRAALLDTVINMGIFPKTNPSTSSAINYNDDLNSVFVTGDSDKYLKNAKYNDNQFTENPKDCTKLEFLNALKKSFEAYKETNILRNVNLPNESNIKAIINETDKFEAKYGTGELGNYPGNLAELWDRLVLVIDSAIRRLEQSLVEKIVTEIKKSLQTTGIKEEIFDMEKMQGEGDTITTNKEELVEKEEIQKDIDESLQCNLVGNQVIDDIMIKFSVEDPRAAISGVVPKPFPKVKKPKIFRDYFEVLKPPTVESSLVDGKGDTVTVSTASPSEIEEVASAQRVKSLFSRPMAFLWENMIVLTSVPSFFVMLLCIYGLIVLLMKPW